jgi:hypothetical protein
LVKGYISRCEINIFFQYLKRYVLILKVLDGPQKRIKPIYLFLTAEVLLPVTLGFFDDIIIPPNALQHPSRFDETEQAWVWEYNTVDGDKHDLFMDPGRSDYL